MCYLGTEVMERTESLGVLGGALTATAGLLGYFVLPALSSDRHFSEIGWEAYSTFMASSYSYHALVLVVPSFSAVFLGTLLARKSGQGLELVGVKLVTLNVAVPVVTAVGGYFASSIIIAVAFAMGASGLLAGMVTFSLFLGYSLVFGIVFAAIAITGVVVGVLAGSVSGYLLAWSVVRGWGVAQRL